MSLPKRVRRFEKNLKPDNRLFRLVQAIQKILAPGLLVCQL